jgi:TrmH family RNA methyltransferase
MIPVLTSLANRRVKQAVKLRQRSHRDELGLMLIEGYREVKRALDNRYLPHELYFAPALFQGGNEPALLERFAAAGVTLVECTEPVFRKISYRDRPDGLLAIGSQRRRGLAELALPPAPLTIVAQAIEKPGNLGTILRSADAAGVHAVVVCDRCTDIFNPNVVRASVGTVFSVPLAEASTAETLEWLRANAIKVVAAMPDAETTYTDVDMRGATAIVVGAEQYGLTPAWAETATHRVRIPMFGQADSLNVAGATTILLYEAVRQRGFTMPPLPRPSADGA